VPLPVVPLSPATLPRVGRLLGIVHKLVAYGTSLITTLQHGSPAHCRTMAMLAFGTRDLGLIIARIKCGLQRAAALQARLNAYVARGRDLTLPEERRPRAWSTEGARSAAPKVEEDAQPPAAAARDTVLVLLPSAEEIAEQVRTRPLGTVISDICRDMGLSAGLMDGGLWEELTAAMMECGIDLGGFIRNSARPVFGDRDEEWQDRPEVWPDAWPDAIGAVDAVARPP
jgi:hypothetical protein